MDKTPSLRYALRMEIQRRPLKKIIGLAVFVAGFQLVGGLLGWLTSQDVDTWYAGLDKSPLNPPGPAFGIAWTILYILLAVAAWRVWANENLPSRKTILTTFAAHMVLNWAWTPVFFTAHLIAPAFFLIVVLIVTALWLARRMWPHDRLAALLFVPYILWLTFAAHLNFYIWQNNA